MAPQRKSTRSTRGRTDNPPAPARVVRGRTTENATLARATRGRNAEDTVPPRTATNPPAVNHATLDQLVSDRVAVALAAANNSTTNTGTSRPPTNNCSCSYNEFKKVMDGGFKGTEGAIGLLRWIEKLETLFQ